MQKIKLIFILVSIFMLSGTTGLAQQLMTLDEYLARVEKTNPGIKALDLSIESAGQKILEMDMVYSPLLSGGYNYSDDKSGGGLGSALATKELVANAWNIGLSKKFQFGSQVTFGYNSSRARFNLLSPADVFDTGDISVFTGYDMKPFLQIEQSLLRDFNSGLTKAGIKKAKAAVLAGEYMLRYQRQQILLGARVAYWNVSLGREVAAFRKLSLERTAKLLNWVQKRVDLDLAEESDLLQAQAGYKLRQLNLLQAQEDEIKASRDFNQMLGLSAETAEVDLEKLSDKISAYGGVDKLTKSGQRTDVLSAKATYESSQFAEEETKYRARPEVSLSGVYSLHGLGLTQSDSWDQVTNSEKPFYSLGISLIVPLDYKTLNKVKEGYKKDFLAAKESLNKAELAAQKDWEALNSAWNSVKAQLKLAQEIKDIQERRVQKEQAKLEKGRSTTFAVLTAENDLDDAALNVYRLVFEELATSAQAELYSTR
ncbi:MAG: TolC family protein [bacterium]